ncbi:DUF5131 family protein [uncultured Helicobacter sp.]|uniref:DUF5131 family protein n=1 Tax=uncultured Helicobacter sp. TaxID=175537 RepID=UPI00374EF286
MSKIEWTDKTWNVITGCTQVSPACQNCYAKALTKRLQGMAKKGCKGAEKYIKGWDEVEFHTDMLGHIFNFNKYHSGHKVFVNSMSDTFHDKVSYSHLKMLFNVMGARKDITFQVLTKREMRMYAFLTEHTELLTPNICVGVTAENQAMVDKRVDWLVYMKTEVKRFANKDIKIFVSCEPLLEYLDLSAYINELDWVILGGERANKKGRVMEFEWVKSLYEQCKEASTPFFFKQWGDCEKIVKDSLKGDDEILAKAIENTKDFPNFKQKGGK